MVRSSDEKSRGIIREKGEMGIDPHDARLCKKYPFDVENNLLLYRGSIRRLKFYLPPEGGVFTLT